MKLALALGIAAVANAQSGREAEGAGEVTGVPSPDSTVDNPDIDLSLFRPTCIEDEDCESLFCENDDDDINVQDLEGIFYCGPPQGDEDCQTVADAADPDEGVFEFQRVDGICNNLNEGRELYGSREHLQLRRIPGVPLNVEASLSGAPDQVEPVRDISDEIIDQISSIPNQFGASTLLVYMGQFIDHDITLIEFQPEDTRVFLEGTPPLQDEFFFELSVVVEGSEPVLNPNGLTAWADLSMVYGSTREIAFSLRDPMDWPVLDSIMRDGDIFLPRAAEINVEEDRNVPTAMSPALPGLFAGGDIRTNEQIMLTSFHTLFMREHNRLVEDVVRPNNPIADEACPEGTSYFDAMEALENDEDDITLESCELLYQLARRVNIAQWQRLVFVEYFDAWHNMDQEIDGPNSLPDFVYNDTLSPDIDIFFSTASYRFGHTGVVNYVARKDEEEDSTVDSIFLGNAFFNPNAVLRDGGIDTLLNGAANQCHERRDVLIVSGIRNFLFGNIPDSDLENMDLPSFNLERGRDHEIALYNDARVFYGLEPLDTFDDIVSAPGIEQPCLAEELARTFGNDVDNCDPFVCGLAEPSTRGELGELWFKAQEDQFLRIRNGDRFHYLNEDGPTPAQLEAAGSSVLQVSEVSMQDILNRNTFEGTTFDAAPFQTSACCVTSGDTSDTPVCVRDSDNLRRFEVETMEICDVLEELESLNFVAGTMNPLSFRSYSCECRPIVDTAQEVQFVIVLQNRPEGETSVEFLEALQVEMNTVTLTDESVQDRFPVDQMTITALDDGTVEVFVEVEPTDDPENYPAAEELIGTMEYATANNILGSSAIMSSDNMDIVCMDCSPLPLADGDASSAAAGAAGESTLLGFAVPVGAAILGAIGFCVLLAIGCGVRMYNKQNSNTFTSGQESV